MGYLYHGSSSSGIKRLEPRNSTHGRLVYATKHNELAVIFSGRAGDDLTFSLYRNSHDEPWKLVERVPNAFELMFNNSSTIYTLDDTTFKDINTGFAEVVSEVGVDTISEEQIKNVYEKIKELSNQGLIEIYNYPNKPDDLSQDDQDLVEKQLNQCKRTNKEVTHETFDRLLYLHPHLLSIINATAISHNNEFIPYQESDIIDIFERYVFLQMAYPNKEQFLESAFTSISTVYPSLTQFLQEKLSLFNISKNEKLQALLDFITKNNNTISEDLKKQIIANYIDDNRDFSEIANEIVSKYLKKNESNITHNNTKK